MSRVFKKSIVRYLNRDGKQVPKGTPGAKKVKEKSVCNRTVRPLYHAPNPPSAAPLPTRNE